jgi:hypothetical protein
MCKFFGPMGSVSRLTVESQVLKCNMLGDPSVRVVDVYAPAWHDGQGLPLLVDLVDFVGSGLSHTTQFLGIPLPVTFDNWCEVIEERWANWLRQDPVVAVETQLDNLRRLNAL